MQVASWREIDEAAAGTADHGGTSGPAIMRSSMAAPHGDVI